MTFPEARNSEQSWELHCEVWAAQVWAFGCLLLFAELSKIRKASLLRGWPPGTHPLALPTLRHWVECIVSYIFSSSLLASPQGTALFSCWWNWDQYHLQTAQTKGFRRGQSCCFKLDFFCLCDLWIFLYPVFCPVDTENWKLIWLNLSKCNLMCILFNLRVFEF